MLNSSKKSEALANTYELEVGISGEDFRAAILKVYNKQKSRISIPGFRKGKASLAFIEGRYGKNFFYEDALELIYPETVEAALKEAGLEDKSVDAPNDVKIEEIGEEGVRITMKITVKPEEVDVGTYKGLEAVKDEVAVTDEEVNSEIDALRERNSRMITVEDRAAAMGDTAVIDFEGFVDGVAFDGGKGEGHSLVLGSGQFIPGFEEQVAGHAVSEDFDVSVSFPEDYGAEELAGKAAIFKCRINEIKFKEIPELDDEFVKDVSDEFETVDQLREGTRKNITALKTDAADKEFEASLLEQVAEGMKADIPEVMFTKKAEENKENFSRRIAQQGIDIDTYLMYMGIEQEKFEQDMLEQAKRQVKLSLALEKVAELEGIEASETEIEDEYTRIAELYKMEPKTVKGLITPKDVAEDLVKEKAVKVIVDSAKAVKKAEEKPAEQAEAADAEEKPAKKLAAKKPAAKKPAAKKPAATDDKNEAAE